MKNTRTRATSTGSAKTKARLTAVPEPEKNKGGRPRLYSERVQLNTRTSDKTRLRLKKQADRRGVSVSYMVDRALQESLERWEAEKLVSH
jgi:predicted HicB family RNase H-like nuclease